MVEPTYFNKQIVHNYNQKEAEDGETKTKEEEVENATKDNN